MIELNSILVVSSSEKGMEMLVSFLKTSNAGQFSTAQSGSNARRLLAECDFDLVVINTPLTDEFGDELAAMVTEKTIAGALLIVKSDYADEIAGRVEDCGVLVIPKPFTRALFFQQLHLVNAARMRLVSLHRENLRLQRKIEEIKLVDRAKWTLISRKNMDEESAHHYIEHFAMDSRITRGAAAKEIIEFFGEE